MKNIIQYKNLVAAFPLMVLIFCSGCNKLVDVGPKRNTLTSSAVFSDSVTVNAALIAMYSQGSAYSGGLTYLNSLYGDELTNVSYPQYQGNALTSADQPLGNIWLESYATIYKANAVINGVESSSALSPKAKLQAAAEAKFFRAFCHFYLINQFGSIPLITTTDADVTAFAPQTSAEIVYQQIVADLLDAAAGLPADYSLSGGARVRVNQFAARALLARVYLYMKDYQNARTQSALVIASSNYNILTDLNAVFLANSREAIWQYDSKTAGFPAIAQNFVPAQGTQPQFIIAAPLLNSFEREDKRKTSWIATSGGFPYPSKYFALSGGRQFDVVLRLAEQYLIRAEAEAQLGDLAGAREDLDIIRKRAGLENTTASDKASLLLAVEQERRAELFCEWGHRFLDLKRTGRLDAVLGTEKPGVWKPAAAQYPVPAAEISKNPNLVQNAGY
ncbi:RagB/SusD family nutrient uptake outer membrane protein [Pararcticibacter amylolyticus]|uniref:RagB/SusD family nutrient uptake outer membrane protein n=1 Tax=Pararcticibacter amylolyticus TaxID=2173175 RepID=A0A2U2PJ99_9SPHI|nr:RagB/SusD family nutrient uptake outer membrane protein [Pararcticibacter amylolyticus]PWG81475.1 hypothetical protein DDR33_06495 [Pararcticibacter amylolyticus]